MRTPRSVYMNKLRVNGPMSLKDVEREERLDGKWAGIGYHYVILKDGFLFQSLDERKDDGDFDCAYDQEAIGVLVVTPKSGKTTRKAQQQLKALLDEFQEFYHLTPKEHLYGQDWD